MANEEVDPGLHILFPRYSICSSMPLEMKLMDLSKALVYSCGNEVNGPRRGEPKDDYYRLYHAISEVKVMRGEACAFFISRGSRRYS